MQQTHQNLLIRQAKWLSRRIEMERSSRLDSGQTAIVWLDSDGASTFDQRFLILILSVLDSNSVTSHSRFFAGHTHGSVGLESLEFLCKILHLNGWLAVVNGLDGTLELRLCTGVISLLQDNQVGHVRLKAFRVELKRLVGLVLSAVIDGDANGPSILGVKAGSLKFLQRKALTETCLGGILLCRTMNNGTQLLHRSRSNGSSLLGSGQSTRLLAGRLVQGQLDLERATRRLHVLLVAVNVRDDIVVLDHGAVCFS